MIQYLFVFIAVLGLLAALGTVLARNLVHAALYLIAYFFVVACVFVLLEAEFLAAIQVLVYIGAVAILLMFGIMLTRNIKGDDTTIVSRHVAVPAAIAALALFGVMAFGISKQSDKANTKIGYWGAEARPAEPPPIHAASASPRAIAIHDMGRVVGFELVNRYAVGFEVAGLLLTAALVGAVALAHREEDEDSPARGSSKDVTHSTNGSGPASGADGSASHAPAAVSTH